jgi:hypothetical protein
MTLTMILKPVKTCLATHVTQLNHYHTCTPIWQCKPQEWWHRDTFTTRIIFVAPLSWYSQELKHLNKKIKFSRIMPVKVPGRHHLLHGFACVRLDHRHGLEIWTRLPQVARVVNHSQECLHHGNVIMFRHVGWQTNLTFNWLILKISI